MIRCRAATELPVHASIVMLTFYQEWLCLPTISAPPKTALLENLLIVTGVHRQSFLLVCCWIQLICALK
jgi:hypothetical protein